MRRASVVLSAIFLMVLLATNSVGSADVKKRFVEIGKFPTYSLSIDRSRLHKQVDRDGDALVGSVFRMTYTQPMRTGENRMSTHVVSSVIAVCGYGGVIVLQDELFGAGNVLQETNSRVRSFKDTKTAGYVVSEIYKNLCAGVKIQPKRRLDPTNRNIT